MTQRQAASLEVADLSFRYPGAEALALDAVSFRVEPGIRLGLLGPNGAGKSTLMRLVCGYLAVQHHRKRPAPRLRVSDLEVERFSRQVRAMVGYLPEQVPLYLELRVDEHLEFRAAIKHVPRRARKREIGRVAELTGLSRMLDVPIHKLSRGYRQRVGIADALLGAPPLVVLDEPTVGLDPNQVQGVRAMLRDLGGEQTLIFSSHILAEVEALCDRIVILSRGKVVADEAVDDALVAGALVMEVSGEDGAVDALLRGAGLDPSRVGRVGARDKAGRRAASKAARKDGADPAATQPAARTIEVTALDDGYRRVTIEGVRADLAGELPARLGESAREAGLAVRRLERGRRPLEARFAEVTGATHLEASSP